MRIFENLHINELDSMKILESARVVIDACPPLIQV